MRRQEELDRATPRSYRTHWVALEDMSPYLVCSVVEAEDRRFFFHDGFDYAQLEKAYQRWRAGEHGMGGSTITQQLARNLFLGPQRSVVRKLREAVIAIDLERLL